MIYNLTPILKQLNPEFSNAENWKNKITSFFDNDNSDPELLDEYYAWLINNLELVRSLLEFGYLTDPHTGLFAFDNEYYNFRSSFNMAHFIERNKNHFLNKKILTMTTDGGIMNIQLKMCGLNLVNSIMMPNFNVVGSILTCIGNNSAPYMINKHSVEEVDIIFINNFFDTSDMAYNTWNMMIDMKIDGKEVYFTTQSFAQLQKHMIPARFEPVEDPILIYDKDEIADLRYGYNNKIYRMI